MEIADCLITRPSRKRKLQEEEDNTVFSMDDLNEDLLERVLSWLPTSSLFRASSVCKRWKSIPASQSFMSACSQVPRRDPWFFMVDSQLNKPVIFDSTDKTWKTLNHQPLICKDSMPVASSGGLLCFRNDSGSFTVSNPVTGSCAELPILVSDKPLNAIVMNTCSNYPNSSYKLVLVYGELPRLSFRVFNSRINRWEDEIGLIRKVDDNSPDPDLDSDSDSALYFLGKAGNVLATNMQRSPLKQYSSVLTTKHGEETVYFLSSSGTVVACNLAKNHFSEYPRLLPVLSEYSIDVVECAGQMLVVLLSEFLESASLRVWRFDEVTTTWQQVAAMPPAMAFEFYGKKADINCVGAGNRILACLSSTELCRYVVCDLGSKEWSELPKCSVDGEEIEFTSSLSLEPRIEACV